MLETLKHCPICQHETHKTVLSCKDYTVSQENFAIVQCQNCNFRFTNPRPDEQHIGKYYQSEEYISHNDQQKGLISFLYKNVRHYTLRQKLKQVEHFQANKGKLLDIGCGVGSFLSVAQQAGWQVIGTEPDEKTRLEAQKRTNSPIAADIFALDTTQTQVEAITMWHVLEHVHRLEETLSQIKKLLAENGTLVIAVPNPESWDATHFQAHWAAYDVPRHLYHFSQENLQKLLAQHGFELLKTYPMKFDAYYISLLSNRYLSGKARYLKSFWQGVLSNDWAKKNQQNYSSLTYIFKQK